VERVSPRSAWTRAGLVLLVVLAADQATKAVVNGAIPRGGREELVLGAALVNVRNTGIAFGALSGGGAVVTVVVALALLALLAYFARHATKPLAWLPTGLLLGGALGNAVDRIREGAVVDFVKLPSFPAFNLADTSITLGVLVLLWVVEKADRAERREAARREAAGDEAERPA
jgi:signal peptidase II